MWFAVIFLLLTPLSCSAGGGVDYRDVPSLLVKAALERTKHKIRYDGHYYTIGYPNGDVPEDAGGV